MASVSVEQISALLDFLEINQELALGFINRTKEGRCTAKRLWEQCAAILNGISPNCVQKTSDQWRTYFNEYKSKFMKKNTSYKAGITGTGGGPSKKIIFTPCQERLRNILGEDLGEPLEGVRHNPLPQSEQVVDIVVIEQNPTLEPGTSLDNDIPLLYQYNEDNIDDDPAPCPAGHREPPPPPPPPVEPPRPAEPAGPPRRRRRRRLNQPDSNDPVSNMNVATERLEAMENLCVEAINGHSQAVHRLAAAFERIADRMGDPQPPAKRRLRIYSSDEE